mmetsp:Transcript_13946/g.33769  ORF Transcript_13946/g.33769 Transcript_13946/m.33769 type:complete len:258 (+) Transcript_13946:1036-1809(+)
MTTHRSVWPTAKRNGSCFRLLRCSRRVLWCLRFPRTCGSSGGRSCCRRLVRGTRPQLWLLLVSLLRRSRSEREMSSGSASAPSSTAWWLLDECRKAGRRLLVSTSVSLRSSGRKRSIRRRSRLRSSLQTRKQRRQKGLPLLRLPPVARRHLLRKRQFRSRLLLQPQPSLKSSPKKRLMNQTPSSRTTLTTAKSSCSTAMFPMSRLRLSSIRIANFHGLIPAKGSQRLIMCGAMRRLLPSAWRIWCSRGRSWRRERLQ